MVATGDGAETDGAATGATGAGATGATGAGFGDKGLEKENTFEAGAGGFPLSQLGNQLDLAGGVAGGVAA